MTLPTIQALYLGEAKRKKLLNEFLIPARSDREEHRDKAYRKVELLVVCDMLLTGFDAPILQALYLDKKLQNHSLVADDCAGESALRRDQGARSGAGLLRHLRQPE